jgi:hypothetical protein
LTTDHDAGNATLHHLWQVQKQLMNNPNPSALSSEIPWTISNLTQHISVVANAQQHQLLDAQAADFYEMGSRPGQLPMMEIEARKAKDVMSRLGNAASRIIRSQLIALTKLAGGQGDRLTSEQGAVVSAFTHAASALFNAIKLVVEMTAEEQSSEKQRQPTTQKRPPGELPPIVCQNIIIIINNLLGSLDARHKAHVTIFEGILFYLFQRVGECLHFLTFGYTRTASIAGDIEASEASEQGAEKKKTIVMEVPHLVPILKKAVSLAPSFLEPPQRENPGPSATIQSSRPSPARPNGSASWLRPQVHFHPKTTLSQVAREKLQETLANFMFGSREGDEGDADNDKEFENRLRAPVEIEPLPPEASVEEEDVAQWFTGEVWKCVGWEVLGREGDW